MSNEERELQIDIPAALDKAAKVFMEGLSVWLVAGMVFFAAAAALGIFSLVFPGIPFIGWILSLAVNLVFCALYGVLFVGLLRMARKSMRGERPRFEDLFSGFGPALFPAAVASIVVAMLTVIGGFLCILPGLAIAAIYLHVYLFVSVGERDFWAAMESSRKLVFDNFGTWLLVFTVVFCLELVGAALCLVGLIPAIPFAVLFLAAAYEAAGVPGGVAENEAPASELPPRSD